MSSATQSSIFYDPEARFIQLPRRGHNNTLWTEEDKRFHGIFERAEFLSTKFAYRKTMKAMGIAEGVDTLLESMQLGKLAHMDYNVYPHLCRDFLSTINLIEVNGLMWLEFLLGDRKYQISMMTFCNKYSFPDRDFEPQPHFSQSSNVWRNITLPIEYVEGESRLSMVKNPTVRYVLNLLVTTYFGRYDCSFPTTRELLLLYNAVRVAPEHQVLEFYPAPNPGSIFLRKLIQTKFDWDIPDATPEIYGGAFLTSLFQEFPQSLLHQFINNDYNMRVLPLLHPIAGSTERYNNLHMDIDGAYFFTPPLGFNTIPQYN
ncbi:unnamed protein product [Arabis nemorensis]|uniref:Arabidopsis retrotransposon Orf1 C-terminal domain-containing protein n=1 Tax=Arabis nemorensis TaxID=586526 RepID=A0A565BID7_9BRAS|nr:unnamed protein product [Arabis nemorensis]